ALHRYAARDNTSARPPRAPTGARPPLGHYASCGKRIAAGRDTAHGVLRVASRLPYRFLQHSTAIFDTADNGRALTTAGGFEGRTGVRLRDESARQARADASAQGGPAAAAPPPGPQGIGTAVAFDWGIAAQMLFVAPMVAAGVGFGEQMAGYGPVARIAAA